MLPRMKWAYSSNPTHTEHFRSGGQFLLVLHRVMSRHCQFIRHALTEAWSHDCVARQHDVSARFLVDTSVALHDPLGRSVVEYSDFCANETLLERPFCAMELFMHTACNIRHSFACVPDARVAFSLSMRSRKADTQKLGRNGALTRIARPAGSPYKSRCKIPKSIEIRSAQSESLSGKRCQKLHCHTVLKSPSA